LGGEGEATLAAEARTQPIFKRPRPLTLGIFDPDVDSQEDIAAIIQGIDSTVHYHCFSSMEELVASEFLPEIDGLISETTFPDTPGSAINVQNLVRGKGFAGVFAVHSTLFVYESIRSWASEADFDACYNKTLSEEDAAQFITMARVHRQPQWKAFEGAVLAGIRHDIYGSLRPLRRLLDEEARSWESTVLLVDAYRGAKAAMAHFDRLGVWEGYNLSHSLACSLRKHFDSVPFHPLSSDLETLFGKISETLCALNAKGCSYENSTC